MTRATAAIMALAVLLLVGCGPFGDDPVTQRVQQPALLTKRQVERQPAGSPARAFFEWWRAIQYDDAPVAVRYYRRSLGITVPKLDRQLGLGPPALGLASRPLLVEDDQSGNTATVLVLLESIATNPNGRADKVRRARGFNLVREDGEWKLADNLYLDRNARIFLKFSAPLREKQQGKQQG